MLNCKLQYTYMLTENRKRVCRTMISINKTLYAYHRHPVVAMLNVVLSYCLHLCSAPVIRQRQRRDLCTLYQTTDKPVALVK